MFKKLLVLLILCGLLLGCAPEEKQSISKNLSDKIIYFKDDRTNLCFAYLTRGGVGLGVTEVPCDKVKEMIQY